MAIPCNCCPTGEIRCAVAPVLFDSVSQTQAGAAGWSGPIALGLTIDGVTTSFASSGYNTPGPVATPQPTPVVEYVLNDTRDLVRGVRLWNQCGSILTDADGLGPSTVVEFLDSANVVLHSTTLNAGNGGAPFDTLIPAGGFLTGVKTVRLSSLAKLAATPVAPLWRELDLLQLQPVWACRRSNGALQWYTQQGILVPNANVVDC